MDIDDTGLDIEISLDEGVFTQNSEPVDADFDVLCTDDVCLSDDAQNHRCDDLPVGLLSALKKDAVEAAQVAESKRKLEENSTAMDSFPVSSTASISSSAAVSTAYQTVTAANQTVTAANQTVPVAHEVDSTANQTIPVANQTGPAAYQAISTAPTLNSTTFSADPVSHSSISSADSTATVPKTNDVSTTAFNCLPPQPPETPYQNLVTNITGGAMKELIINHSLPLEDEWSCVETELTVAGEGKPNHIQTVQEATIVQREPVISFEEALEYFQSVDMSDIKPKIQQTIERRGLSAWTHYFFGPPKLRNNLLPSKELTFCLAATTFDNDTSVHVRSLLALYRNLTGAATDCRRFGSHWETIGFQGNDPSTDLRGVGVFGLLQLLYLTSKPQLDTLKKQIYTLSLHKTQNFPFCVMALNLSKLVLQTLREDKLNKLCNKRGDLVSVVNDAFVAIYYKVYHIWKNQNKTIVDSGFVLKDVENQLRKSPQNLIRDLEEYLKNPNAATAASKWKGTKSSGSTEKLDDFVGIADILDK